MVKQFRYRQGFIPFATLLSFRSRDWISNNYPKYVLSWSDSSATEAVDTLDDSLVIPARPERPYVFPAWQVPLPSSPATSESSETHASDTPAHLPALPATPPNASPEPTGSLPTPPLSPVIHQSPENPFVTA